LAVDRGIAGEQGKVAVGGGGGDDLQIALVLELLERADDVPPEAISEGIQSVSIPVAVESGQVLQVGLVGLLEAFDGVPDSLNVLYQIELEVIQYQGIGQLLGRDGGQAERQLLMG